MAIEDHDNREGYCRQLGHMIPFTYCRQLVQGMPCRLVADCWHVQFDVAAWLKEHYTAEQIESILTPPRPKMTTLLDLIERAKQAAE